jgi:predicted DNA-binding protein YlxM (UPF0122 family)
MFYTLARFFMERDINVSILLEYYGELLTKRQAEALYMYYNMDYSLAEIAENTGVTRQCARDFIKKGEAKLRSYEERVGIFKKLEDISREADNLGAEARKIADESSRANIFNHLDRIYEIIGADGE